MSMMITLIAFHEDQSNQYVQDPDIGKIYRR
jgi:hypothetical protein